MISDDRYEEIICGLSTNKHFVKNPIVLVECGHSACKNCVLNENSNQFICKICDTKTIRDLRNEKESMATKRLIKIYLDDIHSFLEKQSFSQYTKLKELFKIEKDSFDSKIMYIEEEIMIRIESIKIELDRIGESFKNSLKAAKNDFMNVSKKKEEEYEKFEKCLNELKKDAREKCNQTEEKFYKYQKNLVDLNEKMELLKLNNFELDIKISDEKVTDSLIGKLVSRTSNIETNTKNRFINKDAINNAIKDSKFETINLVNSFDDFCILPNDCIAFVSYDEENITVYNEMFDLTKVVNQIGTIDFKPKGITINDRNQIFITNLLKHQIIMTDLEFNLIKTFGSIGTNQNELIFPFGIRFKNYVFVCDFGNRRIQIINDSLDFVLDSIQLEVGPSRIEISNQYFCISGMPSFSQDLKSDSVIMFYETETCNFNGSLSGKFGRISNLNSHFYIFDFPSMKFLCYEENGKHVEDVDVKNLNDFIDEKIIEGVLFLYKDNLYFRCFAQKKLLRFLTE